MEFDALQNASCFGRLEGFIEGSRRVSIEIVLHDTHVFGMRIDLVDQPADAMGVVNLGPMLRHLHMSQPISGSTKGCVAKMMAIL
jgi:hypothetical protein